MQFLYDEQSGKEIIELKGENFNYLVKVRRHKEADEIALRNTLKPDELYIYNLKDVEPKRAKLVLKEHKTFSIKSEKKLHIGWCVIDTTSIEKALPMLNEIGLDKITFIYCDRSQKNTKLNLARFERLLNSSSMQCGRDTPIKIVINRSLDDFLQKNPETVVIDFSEETLEDNTDYKTILVGCEGGFSKDERTNFKNLNIKTVGLNSPMILRSESAVVAVSSKILL